MKGRLRKLKVKASTLLSSVLVLTTCLLFLQIYQAVYHDSIESDLLLIEYLIDN